jgi:hypothetical protein
LKAVAWKEKELELQKKQKLDSMQEEAESKGKVGASTETKARR